MTPTDSPLPVELLAWLPRAIRPENNGQVVLLLIGAGFAVWALAFSWSHWQIDLRRLLWAGRLTRTMMVQGWHIHREARRQAAAAGVTGQERIDALADAAWEERPLLDREIEARIALWLLSQPWHEGPEREHRFDEGWIFVTRSEALRLVGSRRLLRDVFEEIRRHSGNLPRTRSTLLQLVPEVGGRIQRGVPG